MKDLPEETSGTSNDKPTEGPSRKVLILRYSLFILAGLLSLVAVFYVVENVRGARAWKAAKAKAAAMNESLDMSSIIPAPIADEQNAATAPIFAIVFDYAEKAEDGSRPHRHPDRLKKLHDDLMIRRSAENMPDFSSFRRGQRSDLTEWAEYFQTGLKPRPFNISSNASTPAEIVLSALEEMSPRVEEMVTAARRPAAVFPIAYEDHFAALLPHLSPILAATRTLNLRAQAKLELGETVSAHQDTISSLRLARLTESEPYLISGLVQIAVLKSSLQTLWEGLERHAWNDAQLIEFEQALARINLAQQFHHAMRGERNAGLLAFDACEKNPRYMLTLFGESDRFKTTALRMQPSGWIQSSKAALVEAHLELIMPVVNPASIRFDPVLASAASDTVDKRVREHRIREWMDAMIFPAIGKALERYALTQSYVNQARVACALERARLQSSATKSARSYPANLSEVTKLFPDGIPGGPCTGKPLRYGVNADGSYYLYSEGWNLKDDGGTVSLREDQRLIDTEADCVWSFPDGKKPAASAGK